MKRRTTFLLACLLALSLAVCPARAAAAPAVLLDGTPLSFDVPPAVADGRVLVPFRAIFEALGYEVDWDGAGGVTAVSPAHAVSLALDRAEITVDGAAVPLDAAPRAVNGRVLVPVRAVAEASGCTVLWDQARQTVLIWRALPPYFTYDNLTTDGIYLYTYNLHHSVRVSLADLSAEELPLIPASIQSYGGKLYGRFGFQIENYSYGVYDPATGVKLDITRGNVGDCFVYGDRIYGELGKVLDRTGFGSRALDGSDPQAAPRQGEAPWPHYFTIRDGMVFSDGGQVLALETGAVLAELESGVTEDGRRDFTWGGSAALCGDWYYVPFSGYLDESHGLTPRGVAAWNRRTGEKRFYPVEYVVEDLQATPDSLLFTVDTGAAGYNTGTLYRQPLAGGEAVPILEGLYTHDFLAVGGFVYYTRPGAQLCRVPVAGGEEQVIYVSDTP